MADADVPITAGTGTKIDTRTVGAGTDEHRQVVVIGDPATAANVASADAANGLDVDVTRLPALPSGTNNIGDVDVLTMPAVDISELPAAAALAEGAANPTTTVVAANQQVFNGTTWDRQHGNWRTTTGDTGAKTTSFSGATQTNYDARGAFICIRLGTVSGTSPTMTFSLAWSPDGGTTFLQIGAVSAALNATGQTGVIAIYPTSLAAGTGAGTQNVSIVAPLPRTWRIAYTIGGTSPSFAITAVDVNYCR